MSPSILDPGLNLTLRPMRHPHLYEQFHRAYNDQNWTVGEISFSTDVVDLREKLTDAERHVVNRLVAFFATGDNIVGNNCAVTLYKHINSPEARLYYGRQIFEEMLHVDFYLTLVDEYIPDLDERAAAFAAVESIPSIKQKADFAMRWMDAMNDIHVLDSDAKKRVFLMNLITFAAAIEGLFFFAAFAYVYYLRDRGLLHGLGSGTNWVFRDESCHMRFAFDIIDIIRHDEPQLWDDAMAGQVRDMLREAIDCEMRFAEDALSLGVVGLSQADMRQYLEYVADGHCRRLGLAPMFDVTCPFDFMLKQDVQVLTSFFERTTTEYSVGIGGSVELGVEDF